MEMMDAYVEHRLGKHFTICNSCDGNGFIRGGYYGAKIRDCKKCKTKGIIIL